MSGRSLIADRKLELRVFADAENAALTAGDVDAAVRANVDTCVARGLAVAAAAHANAPVRVAGTARSRSPAYDRSHYGYIPYPQLIAWIGARPLATASNT